MNPTPAARLLGGATEAAAVAETLGHPLAGPLDQVAQVLRHGDGQHEDEQVAAVLIGWLTGLPIAPRYRVLAPVPAQRDQT